MSVTSTGGTSTGPAAADAVRGVAASGVADANVEIVRRATRGDDELLLLVHVTTSWWVARRLDGVTKVIAYIGDVEAERDFDLFLSSPSPRGVWTEIETGAAAA